MKSVVQSFLDRDVRLNDEQGESYLVRSPTVREALTVLATHRGVLEGNESNTQVFLETLDGWLPARLFDDFTRGDYPIARVVAYVFDVVNQGVPQFERKKLDKENEMKDALDEDAKEPITEIDWAGMIAEYMATYSLSFNAVMEEPWNSFLLMSMKTDYVHSRSSLRAMTVNGIPYIKDDKEREEAMESLKRRAGMRVLEEDEKRAEKLKNQQSQLDKLAAQFQAIGAYAGGGQGEA